MATVEVIAEGAYEPSPPPDVVNLISTDDDTNSLDDDSLQNHYGLPIREMTPIDTGDYIPQADSTNDTLFEDAQEDTTVQDAVLAYLEAWESPENDDTPTSNGGESGWEADSESDRGEPPSKKAKCG